MKAILVLLYFLSLSAFARVEEVELSTCYRAIAPKKMRAVTAENCWLRVNGSETYTGGFNMTLSYNYTAVVDTLIIVTNDHGSVLSEKVYKKTFPKTETFSSTPGCKDIEEFSERALEQFEVFYAGLIPNQC